MTDLELTRLSAKAMGYFSEVIGDGLITRSDWAEGWNPLLNDAQCFSMLKRFNLAIGRNDDKVKVRFRKRLTSQWYQRNDLNRAICECCAKMWLSHEGNENGDAKIKSKDR